MPAAMNITNAIQTGVGGRSSADDALERVVGQIAGKPSATIVVYALVAFGPDPQRVRSPLTAATVIDTNASPRPTAAARW